MTVASGNHRASGHKPDPDTLACVHHFKWRSGVLDDLRRRVERFSSGTWVEHTPAVRSEASRLLEHTDRHSGRIDVADPASPSATSPSTGSPTVGPPRQP